MTEKRNGRRERERLMKCVSKVRAVCVCVCGLGSPGAAWKGLRKALWFLRHTHGGVEVESSCTVDHGAPSKSAEFCGFGAETRFDL